ncbi:MAG: BrnA antitoxin family protein [Alphaproteobacteria bacterium]|nr:BrnA antitoxin family protein [Alphaproteobacteria bacterium]
MKKKRIDLRGYTNKPIDDPDNPEITAEELRRMRPLRENPELLARLLAASEELRARKRGRPPLVHPKVQVTLRLDEEVVRAFKEDGPGWQGRMNDELKKTVKRRRKR